MNEYKIETNCVQAGYSPKNGEPRVPPIVQSTTYKYDSSEAMGRLFDLADEGYFYTRLSNPTNDAAAAKIAALEGGVGAIITASGQSAVFFSLFNIAGVGDHIVSSNAVYGGTFNLLSVTMKRMGVDVTFVPPHSTADELRAAIRPNTKVIFAEVLSNPSLDVLDISLFASVAHENGIPLIVDNTFPTPINCRPFEFGADIVVHSTTKYMDGHATALGGAVVDSGKFDWMTNAERFPGMTAPDASYHGVCYATDFGNNGYINKIGAQLMRDLGSTPSPQNAFYLYNGLQTLALRVRRHCENATAVARFLLDSDKVSFIKYPSLPGDSQYQLAQKYLPEGSSGVISFGIRGGRNAATVFMDSLKLAAIVTHVADTRTSVLHPASTTHRQLSDEQLLASGVSPELIRLSVGIENAEDILDDVKQALDRI